MSLLSFRASSPSSLLFGHPASARRCSSHWPGCCISQLRSLPLGCVKRQADDDVVSIQCSLPRVDNLPIDKTKNGGVSGDGRREVLLNPSISLRSASEILPPPKMLTLPSKEKRCGEVLSRPTPLLFRQKKAPTIASARRYTYIALPDHPANPIQFFAKKAQRLNVRERRALLYS